MKISTLQRWLCSLALVAFLATVALPFFAVYDTPQGVQAGSSLSKIFGDKVLICTVEGFQWVSWEDFEKGNTPQQHKDFKCPVCYFVAHGPKVPEPSGDVAAVDAPYNTYAIEYVYSHADITSLFLASKLQTRAPPHSFIG